MRILLVEGRFYEVVSDELAKGAAACLKKNGCKYDIVTVPGALEIPAVISFAVNSGKYDGYVALGCVIRGETYHFEVVSNESARALSQLALEKNACIGNGILTVENKKQALARASTKGKNKGFEAAEACLKLIELKKKLRKK